MVDDPGFGPKPSDEIAGRLGPHDAGAEKQLLGALLSPSDPKLISSDVDVAALTVESFFVPRHREIFSAMLWIHEDGEAASIAAVRERLASKGHKGLKWESLLGELANGLWPRRRAGEWARVIGEYHERRRGISAAERMIARYMRGEEKAADVHDSVAAEFTDLASRSERIEGEPAVTIARRRIAELKDIAAGRAKPKRFATGFHDLDQFLAGGFQAKHLSVIAGRPSAGKSTLATQALTWATRGDDKPTAVIFNLEMSKRELIDRIMSYDSGVKAENLRWERVDGADIVRLERSASNLGRSGHLILDCTPTLTVMGVRARARVYQSRWGLDALGIDYLQLMQAQHGERGDERIGSITRGLKCLASELGIPVVVLSQMNRAIERREGRGRPVPQLSDLRGSGDIEQDADDVVFVSRHNGETWVDIAKQRMGKTGCFQLAWDSTRACFRAAATPAQRDMALHCGS